MRSIVISLILMSCVSPSLMAAELPQTLRPMVIAQQDPPPPEIVEDWSKPTPKPSKKTTQKKIELNPAALHALAIEKKSFVACQQDLSTAKQAFSDCNAKPVPQLQFWQTPEFAIGAPVGAIILTFIACSLAHCGGGG